MNIEIGPEVLDSYKRLSYKTWYALAEFVDNSTQAYFDHKEELDRAYQKHGDTLRVGISLDGKPGEQVLTIEDNSYGMDREVLDRAMHLGKAPENSSGRSRYGLGMKTAAFWFGDDWEIVTSALGDASEYTIKLSLSRLLSGNNKLEKSQKLVDKNTHYTIIRIRGLHRSFKARTIGKIRTYLTNLFRRDLTKIPMTLVCFGSSLTWDYESRIYSRLLELPRSNSAKRKEFEFYIEGKKVKGWAGVFREGKRKDAGFSILSNDREIVGWPDAYRPETLFGEEGGTNDLANQRLVGELHLDEFDVSHTKDRILFVDDEEERLGERLVQEIGDLKELANDYRKATVFDDAAMDKVVTAALDRFKSEVSSKYTKEFVEYYEADDDELIERSNRNLLKETKARMAPVLNIRIGALSVRLYMDKDLSANDPYIIEAVSIEDDTVTIVVNRKHPYLIALQKTDAFLDFIRQCAYDGVAQWRASKTARSLKSDTVMKYKDQLLRVPYSIYADEN